MHKITPLLLPELQLLKLHSKSKKLGTNFFFFFFFFDLIQSKKNFLATCTNSKTTCNPIVQKSKPENLPNLSLFLSVSPSLSLSLSLSQEKAPNPNTKVPSKFPRLFSFCKLFSL
jgi:hypothetical protein